MNLSSIHDHEVLYEGMSRWVALGRGSLPRLKALRCTTAMNNYLTYCCTHSRKRTRPVPPTAKSQSVPRLRHLLVHESVRVEVRSGCGEMGSTLCQWFIGCFRCRGQSTKGEVALISSHHKFTIQGTRKDLSSKTFFTVSGWQCLHNRSLRDPSLLLVLVRICPLMSG